MKTIFYFIFISLFLSVGFAQNSSTTSQQPITWVEDEPVPLGGRPNPFALSPEEFEQSRRQGQVYAQIYPVDVTGALPPYEPLRRGLDSRSPLGLGDWLKDFFKDLSGVHSTDDFFKWVGLHKYPDSTDTGPYQVALPPGGIPGHRMGVGFMERNGATGFTFSCATCHSGNLFGKTILGLHNRFPRANEVFYMAKHATAAMPAELFKIGAGATEAEKNLYAELRNNLGAVGTVKPMVLGLDTSLAHIALSLSRRNKDAYATKNEFFEKFPRPNWLENNPADSKPGIWWNVKYKNRWGADGAFVRGNPIFTNLLWNELGRGTDLVMFEKWLEDNPNVVRDLTTAVFASEAPKWSDFFDESTINVAKAKEGEKLFVQTCARCHGNYDKAWNAANASELSWKQLVETTNVRYPQHTKLVQIGTDSQRWMGMKHLLPLNEISISKKNNMLLKNDPGYVPPPLVGIFARWPYFHNNSIPNLCAVLRRASERPSSFYMGEANDKDIDFDQECGGYPVGAKTPAAWKTADYLYNTKRKGMTNTGHDEGIFLQDGKEILTRDQKMQIIEFLKTL